MMQKFCCFDLRTGIIRYGIFHLVLSSLGIFLSLYFSMSDENPEAAAAQTLTLGSHVVNLLIKASLTYGAYKENRMFLLPYLILGCAALSIITLVAAIFMFQRPILIILLLVCCLGWYIWLCVLSYYQLLDPRNPEHSIRPIDDTENVISMQLPPPYYDNKMVDAV